MRILQLHSENVKRIKAVDITPQDDIIVLSGKNGEGKTSVLDSIWLALQFRAASKNIPNPLRAGEDKGIVTIDLGEYIVTRKFTPSGTTLEVKTPDGSKISSPQKLLDGMIGDLSFDPWEFSRKTEEEQRQMLSDVLYSITNAKLDLTSFEIKHKELFEKRTEISRDKKRFLALIGNIKPPTGIDPVEEISANKLTQEISNAIELKSKNQSLISRKSEIEEIIKNLLNEKNKIEQELSEIGAVPDVDDLKSQLIEIEENNKRAREVIQYNSINKTIDEIEKEIISINNAIELNEILKAEALENSPLPVKGLRVTPDGICVINQTGDLIPFCQASAAQRLRISLGIAMAANPKLRVIRIADGSLLDDESINIIKNMANEKDFQIWIEYASRNDEDRMGVYIKDGSVA